MTDNEKQAKGWTELLTDEDLSFIKRFVLASGSLKEIAGIYGITYPTVRLRLDRLIQKIKILDEHQDLSRFERLLRTLYAESKIDVNTFKALLSSHKQETEAENETPDTAD